MNVTNKAVERVARTLGEKWGLPESSLHPHVYNDARIAVEIAYAEVAAELRKLANDWMKGCDPKPHSYRTGLVDGFVDGITLAEHVIEGRPLTGSVTAYALAEQIGKGRGA